MNYRVVLVLCLIAGGFTLGVFLGAFLNMGVVVYKEPAAPDIPTQIAFYIGYVNRENITVVNETLATNNYRTFNDVYAMVGFMKLANISECKLDSGGSDGGIFGLKSYRVPKFWLEYDGVIWEVRFEKK